MADEKTIDVAPDDCDRCKRKDVDCVRFETDTHYYLVMLCADCLTELLTITTEARRQNG
jgi:hypothetical protein